MVVKSIMSLTEKLLLRYYVVVYIKTEFFKSLGIDTKLSDYTEDYKGTAEIISKRFEERGWKGIGEKGKVTPALVKQIVEMSY